MEHTNDNSVNMMINRFIRTESRSFSLAKVISVIMQHSFSELTLAKLEIKYLTDGHSKAMINEVSRAAIGELFNRDITQFDNELISSAWKVAYAKGFTTQKPKLH